jgi:hypothetical protein
MERVKSLSDEIEKLHKVIKNTQQEKKDLLMYNENNKKKED